MNDSIDLIGPLFNGLDVELIFSSQRQLTEMVRFEVALAHALEATDVAPRGTGAACEGASAGFVSLSNATAIAQATPQAGNVAIPFLNFFTEHVRERSGAAADFLHIGATSQDLLDTALVLQLLDVSSLLETFLRRMAAHLVALIHTHAGVLVPGRTWMQQGPPIPFSLKAAQWLDAILRHIERIRHSHNCIAVIQFGGAVGTLAALGTDGDAVSRIVADRLGLRVPDVPWHSQRDRIAEFATTLALLVGTLGKFARDLSLMVQTEIAEVRLSAGSTGGSSTMPHKRNPVGLAIVLSAAVRAPGLASAMLSSMVQEHERGLGGWQAEWETMPELCKLTCGAAGCMADALGDLQIDEADMQRNLQLTRGVTLAESVSMRLSRSIGRPAAHALLKSASQRALEQNVDLLQVLRADPRVTEHMNTEELEAALNPSTYLGSSSRFVRQVLAAAEQILAQETDDVLR